jgi:hypothetical protein
MKPLHFLLPTFLVIAALIGSISLGGDRIAAQAPPAVPHTFFGISATLDGAVVASGTLVVALGEDGTTIASGAIDDMGWVLRIDPDLGSRVRFTIGDATPTAFFDLAAGGFTEVSLALTSTASEDTDTDPAPDDGAAEPTTLPSAGSGGLSGAGDDARGTALLILIALVAAFGAIAGIRFTRART